MSRLRLVPPLAVAALTASLAVTAASASIAASAAPLGLVPGTVLIADSSNNRVVAVTPAGSQTTVGTGLNIPDGVVADTAGDVYIADSGNNRVVEVAADGTQTTVPFTDLGVPASVAIDGNGNLFVLNQASGSVTERTPGGTQTTVLTGLSFPFGLAVDAAGDVFATDSSNNKVIEVALDGTQSTVPATGLNFPSGLAFDDGGNLYIANDGSGDVTELALDGTQTTVVNQPGVAGVAVDAAGNVFYSSVSSNTVTKRAPDGSTSAVGTGLSHPIGLAVVPRIPQTIMFTSTPPGHATVGDAYTVTANGGGSGNPVTFTRNSTSAGVCTVTNDAPNSATVSFIGRGTCAIFAHQAGNDTYAPAPGHIRQQVQVYKKTQTISFQSTPPAHPLVTGHYDVSATASSGLDVSFTVPHSSDAVCAITSQHANAATVSFTGHGTCAVYAQQGGNATYAAAPKVRQRFTVYAH